MSTKQQATALQIDYDCPDRLLPAYQQLLAGIRAQNASIELSATALAGWVRLRPFGEFAKSVDWIAPMFYDLWVESAEDVRPLADPDASELIEAWASCPVPWEAGLPSFARVTLFGEDGRSLGHFPDWPWDTVCFHPALEVLSEPSPGVTLLRARNPLVIQKTEIKPGNLLAARIPDREVLAMQQALAKQSGARGVIWFRLPGPTVPTGLSTQDALSLSSNAQLKINLAFDDTNLLLSNSGRRDLPLRIAGRHGNADRGYQLEIDAGGVARFAEAGPGDFVLMRGHIEPESEKPIPVRVPAATRLTFWLSHLSAGDELTSGFIALKPGSTSADLRWRLDGGDWRNFSDKKTQDES